MTSSSVLPFDLVEEILYRIPLEYLILLRLVCKKWYSLFKNKRFIYKYSEFAEERFIRIHNMFGIINPMNETRFISPMTDEFGERPYICKWPHCDGLMLVKFNLSLIMGSLAIWNPILGQIKWVYPRNDYFFEEIYGLGYGNVSRDDYKILMFRKGYYNDHINESNEPYEGTFEIFSIKSNSWKIVDTCFDWRIYQFCTGVSVNGNMYWMARKCGDTKKFIQSFDFSTETFKPKSIFPFENSKSVTTVLSCFRRDKLSLLHQFAETKKIEVWISNKVDEKVMLWNKYLSFASPDLPLLYTDYGLTRSKAANPEYFIDKNDKLRVLCEDETLSDYKIYEIGKDVIKEELEREEKGVYEPLLRCHLFVPSLVSLPQQEIDLPE